ncbi:glycerol-3-phosphate dehydrogenase/oxidase [Rubrivivax albus]|uniref:Glycerol-3-phosphate dehydrogenase n=1 Tax=Rubrivivax albus TaxID=2499835 RepID=A0A3S2TMX8_9BURK|nr:glycerol-3-phosphate dehydrogenase/oxidase [Rubrivivax albus]RVT51656.1 glycerol-3-phosphate dehydrogenase/oxidase [Rubrivivax albus]
MSGPAQTTHGAPLDRAALWARVRAAEPFDLVVVGGGATGCGLALDAAARGFSVALFEAEDFAKGTSSRATKLLHGGVRYLAQGDVGLVREALHERAAVLHNAPHLASRLPFVMPSYHWWERGFYGMGLKAYDLLAGSRSLGDTEFLSAGRTKTLLPNVRAQGLAGGVRYWDAQFDDARLAVALARTAAAHGAVVLNHAPVTGLLREQGLVRGVTVRGPDGDVHVLARCVVNATGIWVDALRDMDRDVDTPHRPPLVAPSQGVHLVVDRGFWPGDHALLVPKTRDDRVLFAVPWLGKTLLGTTDTPRDRVQHDPLPLRAEVDFILDESARYLSRPPGRDDVRSVWVGMRPLVKPQAEDGGDTKALSREHTVLVGRSGLVTVTGGKWTTYRAMAEDVLTRCMARGLLPPRPGGATAGLPLVGAQATHRTLVVPPGAHLYGAEAQTLQALPGADRWLWRDPESDAPVLSEAMVRFAARHELAASVEDVLARRSRLLFLDARAAAGLADDVAAILAEELGDDVDAAASSAAFRTLAQGYATLP